LFTKENSKGNNPASEATLFTALPFSTCILEPEALGVTWFKVLA
jgi:hypothetical protein